MNVIRSKQEIEDLAWGCTFMGTGGGGNPKDGIAWLSAALEEGHEISWTSHTEIADDAWTVCPFLMGSTAPLTDEAKQEMQRLGLGKTDYKGVQEESVRLLEAHMGIKVGAVVAFELGGSNTLGLVATAARLGIPAVDGDYAGRAVPEICQSTPCVEGLPLWPLSSLDPYGNSAVIREAISYEMAERIGRFISVASFGNLAMAGYPIKGSDMKRVIVPGTLSKCLEIGRLIRVANETGQDPVKEIVNELDGWLLFEGKVANKEWEDKGGYCYGTHTFQGLDRFKGSELKIWFKNENHVSWLDGKPYVTSPDMLIVVDRETGKPLVNAEGPTAQKADAIAQGQHVAVIGLQAVEQFRSPKGLDVLGPGHFGFALPYTPIENLV